jgi:hypothetical protein
MTNPAPARRSLVKAAAWTIPATVVAAAAPMAAASTPPRTVAIDYINYTAADFANFQISVYRPLAIQITGELKAGERISLSPDAQMTLAGSVPASRTTPFRINATTGSRFSVSFEGLTTVLTVNADLPDAVHNKTISWVPLEGQTTAGTEATILTWPLGSWATPIRAAVNSVSATVLAVSPDRTYSLSRTNPGSGDDD